MTGADLYVNKQHCAAACDLERVKPQPPPSILLRLEPVQSCLGVARVMSNYGYKKKSARSYLNHLVITLFQIYLIRNSVISNYIHGLVSFYLFRRCSFTCEITFSSFFTAVIYSLLSWFVCWFMTFIFCFQITVSSLIFKQKRITNVIIYLG